MTPTPRAAPEAQFPPQVLREYALLADGERGALVGPRGEIAWMCMPAWHSDAVFSSLIGGGGVYAVTPAAGRFVWGGSYESGTLVWRSRWTTTESVIECRDALAYPGRGGHAVILRRIVAREGAARVRVLLDPHAAYGRDPLTDTRRQGGIWTARTGPLHLRWSGAGPAQPAARGGLCCEIEVEAGSHHDLVLELSEHPLGGEPADAERTWETTERAWRATAPAFDQSIARDDSRHAHAVLRGLTSASGGMVAAATTSLPERAEEGRNYDYRYVWIRDQAFAAQAVALGDADPLLDDAVRFVVGCLAADGPELRPAYTVSGGRVPDQRSLPRLIGYPGGSDRIGNWVNRQFQLDVFGEALLVFAAAARHDHLDRGQWHAVETAVRAVEGRWTEPDAGIWEIDDQRWAHSRLTCVAGLRGVAAHAPRPQARDWLNLAGRILASVEADCLHPSGRWQRSATDPKVDAALLLAGIRGAVPPDDRRTVRTLAAVERDLAVDGFVYRYRHDDRPLAEAEGAFVLCGFLAAIAHAAQGRPADATRYFERNRAACGPPGLFAEEYDVSQRQLRGNLPQAFVHALMIEAADRLAEWADRSRQSRE